jgi:hypothetical protein
MVAVENQATADALKMLIEKRGGRFLGATPHPRGGETLNVHYDSDQEIDLTPKPNSPMASHSAPQAAARKTRHQREAELLSMAQSTNGHALLLLECLKAGQDFQGTDDSCPAMIGAILKREYPIIPPEEPPE